MRGWAHDTATTRRVRGPTSSSYSRGRLRVDRLSVEPCVYVAPAVADAKLSQGDFADLINVSRGTVSNYERDNLPGGPRQRLAFNSWAAACGVDVEWLETGQAPAQPEPDGGLSVLRARRDSKPQPSDPKVMGLLTWSARSAAA